MIQNQGRSEYPKGQRMFAEGVVQAVAAMSYDELGIGVKKERL